MNGFCTVISFIAVFSIASLSWASDLKIVHTDPEWKNGEGNVPEKGICSKHGGGNLTPSLEIRGIPTSSKTLRFMFTDDDHGDEGGHGDFTLQLKSEITMPTFISVIVISEHKSQSFTRGRYSPDFQRRR